MMIWKFEGRRRRKEERRNKEEKAKRIKDGAIDGGGKTGGKNV